MTKYPNLVEIMKYHPYGERTACDHARIELELLHAVMNEGEPLETIEIIQLAKLYQCPAEILTRYKIIMLDLNRWKHNKMASQVDALYLQLKYMAKCQGNLKAKKYLSLCEREYQRYARAACDNKLSYGHYLGAYKQFSQYCSFSMPEPKRRGLDASCRRAAGI